MFEKTRLKLTAWYLLIIMFISATFSLVIYGFLVSEIERFEQVRFRGISLPLEIANPQLLAELKQRIVYRLAWINVGIGIFAGGLGYLLAGRTLSPIKEMVEEQNRFISDASHELKTPLTSLKIAFEVWLRNKSKRLKDADEIMKDSLGEVNKLQLLSESLLQLAQYQQLRNQTVFEKISVTSVVEEGIRKTEKFAKQKNISLIQEGRDFNIHGNFESMVELIVILLDNAIKYSSPKQSVKVMLSRNKIKVKDQGVGIEEKDLDCIFDRFYRADSARSQSHINGYGLGLSIAKRIVEIHNGKISVESKVGKGTTFTIDFG
jgi:two-component system, OmpR family, sensor histidine kinase CiaH